MKVRCFPEHNYKAIYFNGKTVRIALDGSKPISELKFPEFYDVKITDYCKGACPYCYMDSKSTDSHAKNIVSKIDDFFGSMNENERPFQVAIGGGEPTEHPDFINSLVAFDLLGITPNYTTNGMFSIDFDGEDVIEILHATQEYCEGVALSCHEHLDKYWKNAAILFSSYNVKLNFHIIISDRESSDRFRQIYNDWHKVVDYFVLLPYGEMGRAKPKEIDWEYMVSVMPKDTSKIAFGANFHQNLTDNPGSFDVSLYDPESMSKFLDLMDMKLYPSSFHSDPIN